MTPRNLLVALVAVAIVAAALTFTFYEPSTAIAQVDAPPRTESTPPPVAAETAEDPIAPAAAEPLATAPQRTEAAPATAPAPGPLARVVGRCVDSAGQPLAGCKVQLHGWTGNSERMDAWRAEHDEDPPWQKLEDVITGDDGRFAFAFWPPPPFQFSLNVHKDGCGDLGARWSKLDEGQTVDVGDVALTPGVRISGRVVDKQGAPLAKTYVSFRNERRRFGLDDGVQPSTGEEARTKDDGSFQTHHWLTPGTYHLSVDDRELESAKKVELVAERPEEVLTIVVGDLPERATISGRVVDEAGAPVAKVELMVIGAGWADARSKADGTFVLTSRGEQGEGPSMLQVRSSEYQPLEERQQVTWGSSDVVVRVKRLGQLTLRVTDEAQQPVSRYTVRMVQTDANVRSSEDNRPRTQGEHEDGTATLPGLRRGKWVLLVEFAASSGLEKITWHQEVGEVPPDRLDLVAHPTTTRELRVLDAAGEPVAGATVRLCDMFGKTFEQQHGVMSQEQWLWNVRNLNAQVLLEGTTDDRGGLTLRGPGDRALGLLVGGDGGCQEWHDLIELRTEDELVVRVDRGVALQGRCTPPEALAGLRRLAGLADGEDFTERLRPRLRLRRGDRESFPNEMLQFVAKETLLVAEDGTFTASGVPAGTWQVWMHAHADLGNGRGTIRSIRLADVTLVAGQPNDITLDLTPTIPGTLTARVLLNGAPVKEGWLGHSDGENGGNLQIDADGRCSGSILPGSYEINLQPPYLVYPSKVVVRAGEQTDVELQFFSGKLTLQLLDPDGAPAANVGVFLDDAPWQSGNTDKDGKLELVRAPASLRLSVLPKRYATQEEQTRLWQEAQARGDKDPFTPLRIPIGEVVLQANGDQQAELRLPASWAQ